MSDSPYFAVFFQTCYYPFAVWIFFIHLRLRRRKKHQTHLMIWSIFSMV